MDASRLRNIGRRGAIAGALAIPALRTARAATPITLGYTATLGFMGAFIAKDRGFFTQQGLDVNLVLIALNSNIPAAIMGGSVQIGGPTPTVMIQADDGGLDLVVVSGCSGVDTTGKKDGLFARKGSGIAGPKDCVGKKLGVPGLNAYFHVLMRKWLADAGVDWNRVTFIETPFTQSADILRSGAVDAVATGEPFSTRIVNEGIGTLVVTPGEIVPAGTSSIWFAAGRDWAAANRPAVDGFRRAIVQAVQFLADDPQGARESAGKFIKLPADILSTISLPVLQTQIGPKEIAFWIDLMAQQGMITDKPDPAKLVFG